MVTISAGYFLSASSLCRAVFSSNGMSATTTVLMLSSMYSLTPWPLLYADQTRQVNFRGFPKNQNCQGNTIYENRRARSPPVITDCPELLLCFASDLCAILRNPGTRVTAAGRVARACDPRGVKRGGLFTRPGCDAEGWPSTRSGTTYIPGSEIRRSQYL